MVEQLPFKELVPRSSRGRGTEVRKLAHIEIKKEKPVDTMQKNRVRGFPSSPITIIFFMIGVLTWIFGACSFCMGIFSYIFWMLLGLGFMVLSAQAPHIVRVFRGVKRKARVRKIKKTE